MDLIKISDSKLKIMLTHTDMTQYNLHNDSVSIADAHVRRVLRQLLEDAREQTGFDSDLSRLYVQMYPGADGGCELFISKIEKDEELMDMNAPAYPPVPAPIFPKPITHARSVRATERRGREMCAYSFCRLHDLICVCQRLCQVGFCGKSSVFVDQKRIYYLFLHDFPTPSLYMLDQYCFLGEYGTRENAKALQTYVGEYAKPICEDNAAQTLAGL